MINSLTTEPLSADTEGPTLENTPTKETTSEPVLEIGTDLSLDKINLTEGSSLELPFLIELYEKDVLEITSLQTTMLQMVADGKDFDAILDKLTEMAVELNITNELYFLLNKQTEEFVERRERIKDVTQNGNLPPSEVFERVFGIPATGEVQMRISPFTLYFNCLYESDFAKLYSGMYLDKSRAEGAQLKDVVHIAGCLLGDVRDPQLTWAVSLQNGTRTMKEISEDTFLHEQEHAINKIIMEPNLRNNIYFILLRNANEEGDELKIVRLLNQYLRYERSKYEALAADEILARFKEGRSRISTYNTLTRLRENGGFYDFFSNQEESFREQGKLDTKHVLISEIGASRSDLIDDSIKRVMVEDYRKLLLQGCNSYVRLLGRGFTKDEVQTILRMVPLRQWEKVSNRLAEYTAPSYENFYLLAGSQVLTYTQEGNLVTGDLEGLDELTGEPNIRIINQQKEEEILHGTFEDLRLLNFPYKTAKEWYSVWVLSGGRKLKDFESFISSDDEVIPAVLAWNLLKRANGGLPDKNVSRVFRAYRMLARKTY